MIHFRIKKIIFCLAFWGCQMVFLSAQQTVGKNHEWSQFFMKKDCHEGYIGAESYEYIVTTREFMDTTILDLPTNKYESQKDLHINAQEYANSNGTCVRKCRKNGEILYADLGDACCEGYFERKTQVVPYTYTDGYPKHLPKPPYIHLCIPGSVYSNNSCTALNISTCTKNYWEVGSWSNTCSQVNATAKHTRPVTCVGKDGPTNDSECQGEKPSTEKPALLCNGEPSNDANKCASGRIEGPIVINSSGVIRTSSWKKTTKKCIKDAQDRCNADGWANDYGYGNVLYYSYTYYLIENSTCDFRCGVKITACVPLEYGSNCSTGCSNEGARVDRYGNCTGGENNCAPPIIYCFLKHTQILLSDNTYKPIEKIKVGDKVIGQHGGVNEVIAVHITPTEQAFFGFNGMAEFVTGGNPFLLENGNWGVFDLNGINQDEIKQHKNLNLTQINEGDVIITVKGKIEVKKITQKILNTTKYSLDVDGDNTYTANDCIVHNKP